MVASEDIGKRLADPIAITHSRDVRIGYLSDPLIQYKTFIVFSNLSRVHYLWKAPYGTTLVALQASREATNTIETREVLTAV